MTPSPLALALAAELGTLLSARGMRVTTIESCTGGMVAAAITSVAGSSGWFDAGFVTYSNRMKVALVDVPETLLEAHGAVSEPVAHAMAAGGRARAGADLSVSITGVAGPGGGTPSKPVGMVCFAWAMAGRVDTLTRHFDGDRVAIRDASVVVALEGLVERAR